MTIDIKKFCGNDATIWKAELEWTRLPWRSGENLRATNGHMMAKTERRLNSMAAGAFSCR